MGQEYPKNTSILGEGIDGKGDQTLFGHMGDYVYAYQKDAIKWDHGPHPSLQFCGGTSTIFKASHSEEERRAPSYHQASDFITFCNHWRKHKNLEVSELMRAAMKAWKPPVWATDKAKKNKEFLQGEEK
ncbi:hypothetical protein OG21DRAFT_1527404 [Imleria badia]|nr:hypothetical protein OG21DRAFT_1527404 [Imleria badia]